QYTLKFEVELDSFPPKHVRQQVLCIQSWIFNIMFVEIHGCPLQQCQNSHDCFGGMYSCLNCSRRFKSLRSFSGAVVRLLAMMSSCHPVTADSFNRSATSAACSALINSSRSPSIT